MFHLNQPGNAMHQHTGLATASTRQYQHTARRGRDRFALGIVQIIKNQGDIHSAILPDISVDFRKNDFYPSVTTIGR